MQFPIDPDQISKTIRDDMITAYDTKNFLPLIAHLKSSQNDVERVVLAWAFQQQSDTGIHIDDVHEDAEDAGEIVAPLKAVFEGDIAFKKFLRELGKTRRTAKAFAKSSGLPIRRKINPTFSGSTLVKLGYKTKSLNQRVQYFNAAVRRLDQNDPQYTEALLGRAYGQAQNQEFELAAPKLVAFVRGEIELPKKLHLKWYTPMAQMALRCAIRNNDAALFAQLWALAIEESQNKKVNFSEVSIMWSEMLAFALDNNQEGIAFVIFEWMLADDGANWHYYYYTEQGRATFERAELHFQKAPVQELRKQYAQAVALFRN